MPVGRAAAHKSAQADNICLARPSPPGEVPVLKVIDFGTAKLTQARSLRCSSVDASPRRLNEPPTAETAAPLQAQLAGWNVLLYVARGTATAAQAAGVV